MFGAILKATNSSFQKCMMFFRSIYMKKVMKLLAFIFEQPSYYKKILFSCMQFSAVVNRYIVKPYLNSIFTNDLK